MTPYSFGWKLAAELPRRVGTRIPSALLFPPPDAAALRQTRTALSKQYPQFHPGAIQDMMQLHAQNDGAGLAKFIRNTQQYYQQNPGRAAAK